MPLPTTVDLRRNKFLAGLSDDALQSLSSHFQTCSGKLSEVLHYHGDVAHHLFFPLDACVSIITTVIEGKGVEVALVGSEGMVGIWAALGAEQNWHEAVVQLPGDFVKIKVDIFRAEMRRHDGLLEQLHRYTRFLLAQVSQTAACNRLHKLEKRLARWLLMTHDQVKTNEFPETHEFLSRILGTDRSEVTLAAGLLRDSKLIDYSRGKVTVLNRKGLEKASCECYRVVREELVLLHEDKI